MLAVTVAPPKDAGDAAWIGLYREDAKSDKAPGRCHFRVFTGDDTCIGRSASIEVTP